MYTCEIVNSIRRYKYKQFYNFIRVSFLQYYRGVFESRRSKPRGENKQMIVQNTKILIHEAKKKINLKVNEECNRNVNG